LNEVSSQVGLAEVPGAGVQQVAAALFGANPPISDEVLEKELKVNQKTLLVYITCI